MFCPITKEECKKMDCMWYDSQYLVCAVVKINRLLGMLVNSCDKISCDKI